MLSVEAQLFNLVHRMQVLHSESYYKIQKMLINEVDKQIVAELASRGKGERPRRPPVATECNGCPKMNVKKTD